MIIEVFDPPFTLKIQPSTSLSTPLPPKEKKMEVSKGNRFSITGLRTPMLKREATPQATAPPAQRNSGKSRQEWLLEGGQMWNAPKCQIIKYHDCRTTTEVILASSRKVTTEYPNKWYLINKEKLFLVWPVKSLSYMLGNYTLPCSDPLWVPSSVARRARRRVSSSIVRNLSGRFPGQWVPTMDELNPSPFFPQSYKFNRWTGTKKKKKFRVCSSPADYSLVFARPWEKISRNNFRNRIRRNPKAFSLSHQ